METLDPFCFVFIMKILSERNASIGPDKSTLVGRNIGQDFQVMDGWRICIMEKRFLVSKSSSSRFQRL